MNVLQLKQQNAELCTTMLLINIFCYIIKARYDKASVAHATDH
jgi:hypothetical protein